jgi:ATP-binding cassette subfamily B protein
VTDHYEDAEDQKQRTLPNSRVIGFVMRYWLRRPGLLSGMTVFTLLAIAADMAIPLAAGRLVDAVAEGPQAADIAWGAWALFVGLYLVLSVVRNIANKFWNPLAALNMRDLTDEGFARIQSFSADWHADAFAGATVRRLSRAMWGYDMVSDAIVMWIGPALLVLIGLSTMMIFRWPMVGLFSLAIVALYIASNVILTAKYARPLNQRSVALDSRIGGALADSVTGNPTVRSFGAEARESARIGEITETWRGAVVRTWNRFTDLWLIQNILLAVLQGGLTGLLLMLWTQGKATPGDVAFGITAFLVMSGYLRNIGENVRMLQKGLDDVEDVARFAQIEPQVADHPGAKPFVGELGEVVFENATFRYKSVR